MQKNFNQINMPGSVIKRLMTEQESLTLKKRFIIHNIDRLALEDRQTVLKIIEAVDRDRIKTLAEGTAYNLDKCPQGLLDVLEYTISRLIDQYLRN